MSQMRLKKLIIKLKAKNKILSKYKIKFIAEKVINMDNDQSYIIIFFVLFFEVSNLIRQFFQNILTLLNFVYILVEAYNIR